MCNNPINRTKARHIHRNYHFVRELVHDFKLIKVVPVRSKNNIADIFTKPLQRVIFQKLRDKLFW